MLTGSIIDVQLANLLVNQVEFPVKFSQKSSICIGKAGIFNGITLGIQQSFPNFHNQGYIWSGFF